MKSFALNAIHGFFGGAIAAAVWSIATNYLRFGYVPQNPLLFATVLTGCAYGLLFAITHAVCKLQPTLFTASAVAFAMLLLGVALSIAVGTFVGWSLMSIGALFIFSCMIGGLTNIMVKVF